jgi:hypothetical protein
VFICHLNDVCLSATVLPSLILCNFQPIRRSAIGSGCRIAIPAFSAVFMAERPKNRSKTRDGSAVKSLTGLSASR